MAQTLKVQYAETMQKLQLNTTFWVAGIKLFDQPLHFLRFVFTKQKRCYEEETVGQ